MSGMYTTKCAGCGKILFTFAQNKRGDLPKVYCSKICESAANYKERFKK